MPDLLQARAPPLSGTTSGISNVFLHPRSSGSTTKSVLDSINSESGESEYPDNFIIPFTLMSVFVSLVHHCSLGSLTLSEDTSVRKGLVHRLTVTCGSIT